MTLLAVTERVIEHAGSSPYRSDWLFGIMILPLLLIVIISATPRSHPSKLFRTVFQLTYSSTIFRSQGALNLSVAITEWLITVTSISTLFYFTQITFSYYPFCFTGPLLWLTDLALISLWLSARSIITVLAGQISGQKELFREYLFNISTFFKFAAFIIAPLNFFVAYLEIIPRTITVTAAVSVVGITILVRVIRLKNLFIKGGVSIFYLILYLCALEIGPLLIFIKYLSETVCGIVL